MSSDREGVAKPALIALHLLSNMTQQDQNLYTALFAGVAVFYVALLALYFVPTVVAMLRRHPRKIAIFVLNLFLGWSFVGWVVALVWACSNSRTQPSRKAQHRAAQRAARQDADRILSRAVGKSPSVRLPFLATQKTCPHCTEMIPLDAAICKFCQREVNTEAEVQTLSRNYARDVEIQNRRITNRFIVTMATIGILMLGGYCSHQSDAQTTQATSP